MRILMLDHHTEHHLNDFAYLILYLGDQTRVNSSSNSLSSGTNMGLNSPRYTSNSSHTSPSSRISNSSTNYSNASGRNYQTSSVPSSVLPSPRTTSPQQSKELPNNWEEALRTPRG